MELTLALDAGAATAAPALPGPGLDPNDPAAEAFAALLATLVATVALPVPEAPVMEAPVTVVAPATAETPAVPVLPLAIALPVAAASTEGGEDGADPALPTAATPVPADAPETPAPTVVPVAAAFSSRIPQDVRGNRDHKVEATVDEPESPLRAERPAAPPAAPAGTATVTPEAVAPVVAPFLVTEPAPGGRRR